jgi:conjugative transposon TraN protein
VQTPPAEGRVLLEATGRERPAVVKKTLNDIYRLNRTEMRLRKKHYGIETEVQGIYVRNDVIYIHLSLYNNSNISFEVEDLHFRIEDRKVAKRTAQQITPLELLRVCNDLRIVRAHQRQRTVFALPKFTMPDDKILVLEIVERNGARHQRIEIRNKQIRLARTL